MVPMATKKDLYILDDNEAFLADMRELFSHFVCVTVFTHPAAFIAALEVKAPTLSMIDLDLGYRVARGSDVGRSLRKMRQYFIIVSSELLQESYTYMDEIGALRVYCKPTKPSHSQPDIFEKYEIFHKSVVRDIKIADQIKSLERRLNDSYLTHACMTLLQIRRDLSFDEAYDLVKAGASNERVSMGSFSKLMLEKQFKINQDDVGIQLFSIDMFLQGQSDCAFLGALIQRLKSAQSDLLVAVEAEDITHCFREIYHLAGKLLPRIAFYARESSPIDFDIKRLISAMDDTLQDLFSRVGIFVSVDHLAHAFEQLAEMASDQPSLDAATDADAGDDKGVSPDEQAKQNRYASQANLLGLLKKSHKMA